MMIKDKSKSNKSSFKVRACTMGDITISYQKSLSQSQPSQTIRSARPTSIQGTTTSATPWTRPLTTRATQRLLLSHLQRSLTARLSTTQAPSSNREKARVLDSSSRGTNKVTLSTSVDQTLSAWTRTLSVVSQAIRDPNSLIVCWHRLNKSSVDKNLILTWEDHNLKWAADLQERARVLSKGVLRGIPVVLHTESISKALQRSLPCRLLSHFTSLVKEPTTNFKGVTITTITSIDRILGRPLKLCLTTRRLIRGTRTTMSRIMGLVLHNSSIDHRKFWRKSKICKCEKQCKTREKFLKIQFFKEIH